MIVTGWLRGLLIAGTLAGLLTGCGASNTTASPTLPPLPTTTSPASQPATGSSSPTTPKPPAVVRAGPPPTTPFTRQGAELFVRDYYATIDAILVAAPGSPSTRALATALQRYGRDSCECHYEQRFFLRHVAASDRFLGRGYSLASVRTTRLAGDSSVVRATFSLGPVRTVQRSGRVVDVQRGIGSETDIFVLSHLKTTWVMTRQFVGTPK